jgi:hypothetical protein
MRTALFCVVTQNFFIRGTSLFRAALTTTLHNPPNYWHRPYWLAPCSSKPTPPPPSPYKLRIGTVLLLDSSPLKMGPISCPETSVRIYHYSLRNNPVERSSCRVHFLTKNDEIRIPLFWSREGRNWQHVIWLENQHTISIDNQGIRKVFRVCKRQNSCHLLLSHNTMWFQSTDKVAPLITRWETCINFGSKAPYLVKLLITIQLSQNNSLKGSTSFNAVFVTAAQPSRREQDRHHQIHSSVFRKVHSACAGR